MIDEPIVRSRRVLASWPDDATPRAVLARTNRELAPAAVAAIEVGRPFRASGVRLLVESPIVDDLIGRVARETEPSDPLLARIGRVRRAVIEAPEVPAKAPGPAAETDDPEAEMPSEVVEALLGWAAGHRTLESLVREIARVRNRLAVLRRDDAALTLSTAHGTKGLEFDDVAVIDMDAAAFPSARSLADAFEPERALEEERRLAYVAWTRARRTLTLVYDPAAPSPFMLEAFTPAELGLG